MELRHVIWNKAAGTSLRSGTDVEGNTWRAVRVLLHVRGLPWGRGQGSTHATSSSPLFMGRALCTEHCHVGKKGVALVPIKGSLNATAYKDVLDEKGPHMGAITGCPHTIGHIVYTI